MRSSAQVRLVEVNHGSTIRSRTACDSARRQSCTLAWGTSLPTVKVRWRRISACSRFGVRLRSVTDMSSIGYDCFKA